MKRSNSGYSLIEILVVITVIAVLSLGTYLAISYVKKNSEVTKLQQDVHSINRAIRVYESSGGSFAGVTDAQSMLQKLKTAASNGREIAAMRGSMIDLRLTYETAQEGDTGPFGIYDNAEHLFKLDENATTGIVRFALSDAAIPNPNVQETRTASLKLATGEDDRWVWAFTNAPLPETIGPGNRPAVQIKPSNPNGPLAVKLTQPVFTPAPPQESLLSYPLTVMIGPLSSDQWETIWKYASETSFRPYTGPIQVNPGESLVAKRISLEPETYLDSDAAAATYTPIPVKLAVSDTFTTSVSYAALGGPLYSGVSPPEQLETPKIAVTNLSQIPLVYQNTSVFQTFWTFDGTSPTSSPSRISGAAFTNGYPGDFVPLSINSFGTGSSVTVHYVAKSNQLNIVTDSDTISKTISIEKANLVPPLIAPESGVVVSDATVTLNFDVATGVLPTGARIYYRIDGQDPGDNNGEPAVAGSSLWTGTPFTVVPTPTTPVLVTTRVYPPVNAKNWFHTSNVISATYSCAPAAEPPTFNPAPPVNNLSAYPVSVTLTNPNDPAYTEIDYTLSTDPTTTRTYTAPISTPPGTTIVAYCRSTDLLQYRDSINATATYAPTNVQLALTDNFPATYNYVQLGGPLAPGSPAVAAATPAKITLSNAASIPLTYQSSSYFGVYWTLDGTSPLISVTRSGGNSFTNGYAGDNVPMTLATFGTTNFVTLKYAADSTDLVEYVIDSGVSSKTVSVAKITLPQPVYTPVSGGNPSGGVTISLNLSGSNVPAGARIYYRTDNVDPGDVAGEPNAGATQWTGTPILITGTQTIQARVYPPTGYKTWFNTSTAASATFAQTVFTNCFASNGTGTIFRFDPTTASTAVVTFGGLFNIASVAYDPTGQVVYYTEDVNANFRLAKYDLTSGTHSLIGSLTTPASGTWSYTPSQKITSLSFFGGKLHYIHGGSDDLVRIDLAGGVIADQYKFADITNGAKSFGVVGDISTTTDGRLWVAGEGEMATFSLSNLNNYVSKRTYTPPAVGTPYYPSLLRYTANALYTNRDGNSNIRLLDANGAEQTSTASSPAITPNDMAAAETGITLPTVNTPFYAVTGGNKAIYQLKPTTGQHILLNDTAPFNIGAIAFDPVENAIYYLEDATSSTWRVGKYLVATNTHLPSLGDLKTTGSAIPTVYPGNLVFYNNALFYIHASSSNLVDVPLNSTADAILDQFNKPLSTSFETVGDLALNDAGMLYFENTQGGNHRLYRYDLRNESNLTNLGNTSRSYPALGFSGGTLYGTGGNAFAIDSLDTSNGNGTQVCFTQPNLTFTDFASGSTAGPPPALASYYAIANNENKIYLLDPTNGSWTREPGAAPFTLAAITWDSTNDVVYYLEKAASNWRIGKYVPATNTYTTMGSNLGNASSGWLIPTTQPNHLVFYAGQLLFIENGTDELRRIETDGSDITGVSLVAHINGGTSLGNVNAAAMKADGTLFFASSSIMASYNVATRSGFNVISASPSSSWQAFVFASNGNLYGTDNVWSFIIKNISQTTGSGTFASIAGSLKTFVDIAGPSSGTPPTPLGNGDVFAVAEGSASILRVNPGTGTYDTITASCLFQPYSVAYDQTTNMVYYAGGVSAGEFRLARFSIASGQHLEMGNLRQAATYSYTPTDRAENLIYFRDGLYYVAKGTDDLVKVTLSGNIVGSQVKVRDLTGNAVSWTSIGGLSATNLGQAYIGATSGDFFGRFTLPDGSGFTTLSTASPRTYQALVVRTADQAMYAARPASVAGDLGKKFHSINKADGTMTFTANSQVPTAILDMGAGVNTPATLPTLYAVGGNNTTIYKFDQATGNQFSWLTDALFATEAIAVTPDESKVYYVEKGASGWRVGEYGTSTATHAIRGSLTTGTLEYVSTAQPTNLMYQNGRLYFIPAGTDDLVAVEFSTSGAPDIVKVSKVADLNGNAALTAIGDIAVDSAGTMFISASNAFATWNFKTQSSFTVKTAPPASYWTGLLAHTDGKLYGVSNTEPGKLYQVDKSTGVGFFIANFSPAANFYDFAGPQPNVSIDTTGQTYFISNTGRSIYKLDLSNGQQSDVTGQVPHNPTGIALDHANGVLYLLGDSLLGNGDVELSKYDLSTGLNTSMGSLKAGGLSYIPSATPNNLAYQNGFLYYLAKNTDDLVKVTLSGNTIATASKIWDVGIPASDWDTLAIAPDSSAYISTRSADYLAKINIQFLSGPQIIKTTKGADEGADYNALTFSTAGSMYGALSHVNTKGYQVNTANGATTYRWDAVRYGGAGLPIMDMTTPNSDAPLGVGDQYAADGTTTIYRVNPYTGAVSDLTTGALFNVQTVAYDSANQTVYYTEAVSTAFRLAKYDIVSNTHTLIGNLDEPTVGVFWEFNPLLAPTSLVFIAGNLYYINTNSDDLIRIDITAGSISNQVKIADITNGAKSFGITGDLTAKSNGTLWVAAENEIATFDLNTLASYLQKRVTTSTQAGVQAYYPGIQRDGWDAIYADKQGSDTNIYKLDASGNETTNVATNPARQFVDYAGEENAPALPQVTGNFFAVNGGFNIYRVNPITGQNKLLTRTGTYNLGALAYDPATNFIFYLEDAGSSSWRVGRYDLTTGTHLAAHMGDLKVTGPNTPTAYPGNLVYYNKALYYIHPNSSNLVKLTLSFTLDVVTEQVNIPLGTTFQSVGDLALDDSGVMYWVNTNGSTHTLYRYDLRTLSGLASVAPATRSYPALGFASGVLYGTGGNGAAVDTINTTTGAGTFISNTQPNQTFIDFAAGSAAPIPVTANFFGITSGNNNIYRVDPTNGQNILINNTAPYNLGALALDATKNYLYYFQDTALGNASWALGRYDIGSGTHSAVGDIKPVTSSFSPTAVPRNLAYYNGALYFVVPGQDDLVKIQLNAAGTAITGITRVVDLTKGVLSFAEPGDLAFNDDGLVFFTNNSGPGSPMLFSYDVMGTAGFCIVGTMVRNEQALGFLQGALYSASQTGTFKVDQLSTLTGGNVLSVTTSPALDFGDFAGPASDMPPSISDVLWSFSRYHSTYGPNVDPRLVKFTNYTNAAGGVLRTDYGQIAYQDGATATLFTAANSRLETMAVDPTNRLYFINSTPTTVNGVTFDRPLFYINLGSLPMTGPVVAYLLGDVGVGLKSALGLGALTSNELVTGMAVGTDGKIRLAVRSGNGTVADLLVTISNLIPNASGDLTVVSNGPLQNGAVSAGNVKGLAINSTGTLYVSDQDDLGVWSANASTGVISATMHSTETTAGPLAMHLSDSDLVTALPSRPIKKVLAGNLNDPTYFNPYQLWCYEGPTAIAFAGLPATQPPAATGYYAADGSNRIYRVDPATGTSIVVTIAPFAVQSVAYDQAANRVYYTEAATSNWRVGFYLPASNLHSTLLYNLTSPGGTNQTPITSQPENLFVSNGGLYTILPNTDDLVKIELTPAGIDSVFKVADLNGNTSQGAVTAATLDSTGMLYFGSTAKLAKFNLATLSGYTAIATNPNIPWSSLVMTSGSVLYGVRSDDPYKTFSINTSNGTPTLAATVSPKVAFTDISGQSGPVLPVSGYAFASVTGTPAILRVDLSNAKLYYFTWQAKANVEALAYDSVNGIVYYTDTSDSPQRIHAYSILTDSHTTLQDASFQTDLKLIGTNRPTGNHAHNLTYFNGALYYIATGTDDLYKITLTSAYVIADQVKVADIAGNATVGSTVGSFTVDDAGVAFISWEDADVLARFDMRTLGGYTVLNSSSQTPRYYGLTYEAGALFGIPFDATVSKKLYTVAVANGTRTLVADVNPSLQILDLATVTPPQPILPAPTSNFFAITGGNKNIYRLDPSTGQNVLLNNTAPYNLGAIAYDQAGGNIFYLEDGANATWNLGKYNVSTNTHSASLGNIKTVATAATSYPANLVYYNNAVYYIHPSSSNLIKVQLNVGATSIVSQTAINLGTSFTTVGDLTLDDTGMLYWVNTSGVTHTLYKYNLRDSTGFATVATTAIGYPSLGFLGGTLYGTGSNAFVIDQINPTTAAASIASTAQPNLTFTDFASGSSASLPASPVWAIGENGNAQLIRINGYDGSPTLTNYGDIRYPGSGGAPTTLAVDSDIESFAVTTDGFAYFVRNNNTNVNGIVYGRPFFRIDLNTVSAGAVTATFLGDLDQALSSIKGSAIVSTAADDTISAMSASPDGALYFVYQDVSNSVADRIFKLTSLATDGGNNLTGWSLIGSMTGTGRIGGQIEALEWNAATGSLMAFDYQEGDVYTVNPATAAITALHSTEAGTRIKDFAINPANADFIAVNSTDKSLKRVVSGGADTTFFSYSTSPPWSSPTFTDVPGLKFQSGSFNPATTPPANLVYACTGGNKDIYTLDLATGATVKVVDNAAAFNLSSLAYDPIQNTVFYLKDSTTGYTLGSWQIATNAHSVIYDMTSNNDYNSLVKPTNLAWWGGYLWFIEPGTDDLIRITSSPTVATQQIKIRDITANTVSFSDIGDLAIDDTGMMYFSAISAGNSVFAKFNLGTLSSYTKILEGTGTADFCQTIVFGPNSGSGRTLYVARDASRTIIRSINTTSGAISGTSTATSPSVALLDTSDKHLNSSIATDNYYAVAGGTDRNIYTVNPETGTSSILTSAPVSFAGLSAIAWDQTNGFLYYVEELDPNFKLGRYSLDTNTHVSLGSMQGAFSYNPASKPLNLGFMRGAIYFIAAGTDDLVRVDVSGTGIVNQIKIADLNANAAIGNAGDLTCGNAGVAYYTAGGKLYSFNVATLATASTVATFTNGNADAVAINSAGNVLYSVFNPATGPTLTTQIHKVGLTGTVGTNVSAGTMAFRDLAGPDLSSPFNLANRFLIGGDFQQSAASQRGIARLLQDTGALDPSFNTGTGPNAGTEVKTILGVGNGQVLGGGSFSTFQGQPRTGVVRLNPDGSVDQSFNPIFK